jgi:hypothetical protein
MARELELVRGSDAPAVAGGAPDARAIAAGASFRPAAHERRRPACRA